MSADDNLEARIEAAIRNPRNLGEMENADAVGTVGSPDCGDMLRMWLKFKEEDGRKIIDRASFQSFGCQTAIAVASVATELLAGKTIAEARALTGEELAAPLGALPPVRIHCAQLVEGALRSALGEKETARTPDAVSPTLFDHLSANTNAKVKVVLDKQAPALNLETLMHENTEFTLSRDTEAIQIPSGTKTTIPAGTTGVITQTLGGSYTIATYQGLSRIAEKDLDALGIEKPQTTNGAAAPATGVVGEVDDKAVWEQLRQCYDPEIPVNIVDLGLVYDCQLKKSENGGTKVEVKMTLTAPGCGMGPAIAHDAQSKIMSIEGVDEAQVDLVWDPPWNQNMISEAGRMKLGMI